MTSHAALAWQNYKLSTLPELPAPWRITVLYYAALHGVNHLLYPGAFAPRLNHNERRQKLLAARADLHSTYTRLEQLSWVARYEPEFHPLSDEDEKDARSWALDMLTRGGVPNPG
jgi:hypothetical protein